MPETESGTEPETEPEIVDDHSAILEDIEEERILEKELEQLERQAEQLEEERARRRGVLGR